MFFPSFLCELQAAEHGGPVLRGKHEVGDFHVPRVVVWAGMSEQEPPPPPLGLILGIIIVADVLILGLLGARGMLANLSPGAQFYYGLMTFGFPVVVYWMLKRGRDKRE